MRDIETIHESLVNGQRRQMVDQINEYGLYDFWHDYSEYLDTLYTTESAAYEYLKDAIVSYHRITSR